MWSEAAELLVIRMSDSELPQRGSPGV